MEHAARGTPAQQLEYVRIMVRWFFSHAFVDAHAEKIVDQFAIDVPVGGLGAGETKTTRKRMERAERAFHRMIAEARRFQKDEKLNVFQRARLAQQVQNRMISLGYPLKMSRQLAAMLTGTAPATTSFASLLHER
jgi:hypothetical protein